MEVKGSATAIQCPTIEGGVDSFAFAPGIYEAKKLCLEPTSFTVKAEGVNKNATLEAVGVNKNATLEFQKTKLMDPFNITQLTKTLSAPLKYLHYLYISIKHSQEANPNKFMHHSITINFFSLH